MLSILYPCHGCNMSLRVVQVTWCAQVTSKPNHLPIIPCWRSACLADTTSDISLTPRLKCRGAKGLFPALDGLGVGKCTFHPGLQEWVKSLPNLPGAVFSKNPRKAKEMQRAVWPSGAPVLKVNIWKCVYVCNACYNILFCVPKLPGGMSIRLLHYRADVSLTCLA